MAKFVFLLLPSCVFFGATVLSKPAQADGAIIWTPVKVAPRVYQTTVGLRLPTSLDTSAGADLGLGTAASGQLLSGSQLATLWGKVTDDRKTLDGSEERALVINIDTLHRTSSVSLSRSKSWIYSSDLDLQTARSLNLNYTATNTDPASINATQSLTLAYPEMGTALTASGTLADSGNTVSGSLALNQPIAPNLDLTASLSDPLSSNRAGDVQMHYKIKW